MIESLRRVVEERAAALNDTWPVWAAAGVVIGILSVLVWAMARGSAQRESAQGLALTELLERTDPLVRVAMEHATDAPGLASFEYADECGGPDRLEQPSTPALSGHAPVGAESVAVDGAAERSPQASAAAPVMAEALRAHAHAAGAAMHARRMARCDVVVVETLDACDIVRVLARAAARSRARRATTDLLNGVLV